MPQVKINLTEVALMRINEICEDHEIFGSHEDVILHAITDLLEKYDKN